MEWSIWTSYYHDVSLDKALEEFSKIGIKYVELSSEHISEIFAVLGQTKYIDENRKEQAISKVKSAGYRNANELKEIMDSLGITMIHAHGPFEFRTEFILKLGNWKKYVNEKLTEWFKIYNILNVPTVVIHPLINKEKHSVNIEDLNFEYFKTLKILASEYQINIAIENLKEGFGSKMKDLRKVIDSIGKDRIGICIDTGHANIEVYKGKVHETFLEAGNYLIATHIHDNDSSGDQHLLPGKGNIDWKKVFEAISKIGYKKPLNLEIPGETLEPLDKRRKKLKDFIKNYKNILSL
ncbi:MAG: sugar phosphate isomerase/epimerase [Thermoproteales archaeon]|nr:sugar phosphate isomerase/epimerase [Thermoproteales archaeon]